MRDQAPALMGRPVRLGLAAGPALRRWLLRGGWLRGGPVVVTAIFLIPVLAGLAGTLAPAIGILPALGHTTPSLAPVRALLSVPGLWHSAALSLGTGLAATVLASGLAIALAAVVQGRGGAGLPALRRLLAPLLALPHAGLAIAVAFLIAPSGWLFRLVSPGLTGWEWPPLITTTHDPLGLSLVLVLVIKETPFLLVVVLAATAQQRGDRALTMARSLGYRPVTAWLKAVLPQVYPLIRLPIYAVLAFSVSVVDVAQVIGPSVPNPLAVRVLAWFNDPDLSLRFQGAAGAMLQLLVAAAAIALWAVGARLVGRLGRAWLVGGHRGHGGANRLAAGTVWTAAGVLAGLAYLGLLALVLWSLAGQWRWPAALPASWSLGTWWDNLAALAGPAGVTIGAGAASAALAVALTAICLENERRHRVPFSRRALRLLYLPLLVPQIAFLFGFQVLLVRLELDGTWLGLIWAHLIFVLPYTFIVLAEPYRRFDPRYERTALCLGRSPMAVLLRVKLPMLLRPLLLATAVGFAVSVTQYLPTLFAGGGRLATLTTEAVTLASGGNRPITALYATAQAGLPLLVFAAALAVPARVHRRRAGMLANA